MNTRRSFLANLAGALAVLVLPAAVKARWRQRIGATFDGERAFQPSQKLYGVRFTIDPNPPRYDWTGTEWVLREGGGNTIGAPNSAYLDAAYGCWVRSETTRTGFLSIITTAQRIVIVPIVRSASQSARGSFQRAAAPFAAISRRFSLVSDFARAIPAPLRHARKGAGVSGSVREAASAAGDGRSNHATVGPAIHRDRWSRTMQSGLRGSGLRVDIRSIASLSIPPSRRYSAVSQQFTLVESNPS